jgi:hypothetical protein
MRKNQKSAYTGSMDNPRRKAMKRMRKKRVGVKMQQQGIERGDKARENFGRDLQEGKTERDMKVAFTGRK